MNLYIRIMAIIILGVVTANCGSDNRMLLSSISEEDRLTIPSGDCEDCVVSRSKLEKSIADRMGSISTVSDLSFDRSLYQLFSTFFIVSFTIQIESGSTYTNIRCNATTSGLYVYLEKCSSEDVKFGGYLVIPVREVD